MGLLVGMLYWKMWWRCFRQFGQLVGAFEVQFLCYMWTDLPIKLYLKRTVAINVTDVFFVLYQSQPNIRCRRRRSSMLMILGISSFVTVICLDVAVLRGSSDIIIIITFKLVIRLYLGKQNKFGSTLHGLSLLYL